MFANSLLCTRHCPRPWDPAENKVPALPELHIPVDGKQIQQNVRHSRVRKDPTSTMKKNGVAQRGGEDTGVFFEKDCRHPGKQFLKN